MDVKTGDSYTGGRTVGREETAARVGSGALEVFSTPSLVALMENTAIRCLEGKLDEGMTTVGVRIEVNHVKATGVGRAVSCKATVTGVEGRRIRFAVEAWDEEGTIGTGEHERVVVDAARFMAKVK